MSSSRKEAQGGRAQLEGAALGRRGVSTPGDAHATAASLCTHARTPTLHLPLQPSRPQRHVRGFTPYSATGNLTASVAPGRLSYTFGLKGPSLPVDTVCSSSLVRRGLCCVVMLAGIGAMQQGGTTTFQQAGTARP